MLEQALDLRHAIGEIFGTGADLGNYGIALLQRGRTEEAASYLQRARELFAARGLSAQVQQMDDLIAYAENNAPTRSESDILSHFEPLLQASAAVAGGTSDDRAEIEATLPELEKNGWKIEAAVHAIWNGKRDPTVLTDGIDSASRLLVLRVLEILDEFQQDDQGVRRLKHREQGMQYDRTNIEAQARAILHEWVTSESLRTHCESVAASMRQMARKHGADEALWSAVALLHDADYQQHPNLELSDTGHPFVIVSWLREHGWPEEVTRAILSHADYSGVPRETLLEKALYACDELSGFVYAVTLVRPSKSIHDVEPKSVKKKLKDKDFAAKVNRDDIRRGAEELGVPLDELIGDVIAGLRESAARLGLEGVQPGAA